MAIPTRVARAAPPREIGESSRMLREIGESSRTVTGIPIEQAPEMTWETAHQLRGMADEIHRLRSRLGLQGQLLEEDLGTRINLSIIYPP